MTTYAGQSPINRAHLIAVVSFASATIECRCGWAGSAGEARPAEGGYHAVRARSPEAVKRLFAEHRAGCGLKSHDGTSTLEGFGVGDGAVMSLPGFRGRFRVER